MSRENENSEKKTYNTLIEENRLLKKEIEQLKKSSFNELFSKARAISSVGYWSYSYVENTIVHSEEIYNIFDIPPSTDLSHYNAVLKYLHPDDLKEFISKWRKKSSSNDIFHQNVRIVVPDGSTKYISLKILVERDKNQKPIQLTGTLSDTTEAHIETKKSINKEALLRKLFDNLTDIFIILEVIKDHDGNITDYVFKDVNPSFEAKLNLNKDEITGRKLSMLPEVFEQFHPLFKLTALTNQPQQDRLFIQPLDSFFDVLIYSPSENIIATLWRDVSLIVEADSALRESEEKYRQIFSIGSDALFMVDNNSGKIIEVNPTATQMFGYTKEQLLKMAFKELSASPGNFEEEIIEQKSKLINEVFKKNDGTNFPVEASLSYFNWSGRKVLVASFRDISERVNAHKELIENEQKFKQLFNYSNDAILIIKNYRIIEFNQKSISLFGIESEHLQNKTLWNLSPSNQPGGEDSRTKAVEQIQNSLLGSTAQFEWIFQKPNQNTFFADIKLSSISYGDEKVIQAIVRDISPQKEVQKALKVTYERWETSMKVSSIGVWDWNVNTNEVYFSPVWKKMLGYEDDELPNAFNEFEKRIHPDDIARVYNKIDSYFLSKTSVFVVVFRLRCKNGTYKWIRSQGQIIDYTNEGKPKRFIGTHSDITKQKITEENQLADKENLKFATDNASIGYWYLNLQTMVMDGPEETFDLFGFKSTRQVSLRQIEKLIHPDDRKVFINQFISSGLPSKTEQTFRITLPEQTKFVFSKSVPVFNQKNILTGYKGFFQEVTQFKKQELEIKEEQRLHKALSEKLNNPVIIARNDEILFSNNKYTELTGFTNKEITSKKITPFLVAVPEDRLVINKMLDTINNNPARVEKSDIRIETKNNRIKWVEIFISNLPFNDENAIMFSFNDISKRKEKEIGLAEKEKQFSAIFDNTASAYALLSPTGQIVYHNKTFAAYTETLNDAKNNVTINNTEVSDEISKGIETITFKIKTSYTSTFQLSNRNNSWVKLKLLPVYNNDNSTAYFLISIEDVNDFKNTISRLENDFFLNKLAIENLTEGIGLCNSKLELQLYNNALLKNLDIQLGLDERIPLGSISALSKLIPKIIALKTGETFTKEVELPGSRYIALRIIATDISGMKGYIVSAIDVTDHKTEYEKIKINLHKYRQFFTNAPVGLALIDKNRQIVLSNEEYSRLTQYEAEELSHKKIDELVTTEYLSEIITKLSQLFTGVSLSTNIINKMVKKDGNKFWSSSFLSGYKNQFGDTEFAIQTIADITKFKEETHSILTNERLQTLNHIAKSFAREFNNNLMNIYGTAYLLKSNINDKQLTEYADKLILSTQRATDLTNRLQSFSSDSNILSVAFDLNEVIEETIKDFTLPGGLKIDFKPTPKKEKIIGNPAQIRQAIQNITQNAVDSITGEGEINIALNTVYFETSSPEIKSEYPKGKYFRIIVTDTGEGIDEANLNKIFDPFFTTKQFKYNSGLGLTISNQIIKAHDGSIKVFSKPGQGTSINIYLPQADDEKIETGNQPDEQGIVKGSANILLVDDEDLVRVITTELLNELGYDVYSFSDGKKALSFYEGNYSKIDLVMLDMFMPEINGAELYEKMRTINRQMKSILLTGYTITDKFYNKIASDKNGIIQKPVSIKKLSQTISEILYK